MRLKLNNSFYRRRSGKSLRIIDVEEKVVVYAEIFFYKKLVKAILKLLSYSSTKME